MFIFFFSIMEADIAILQIPTHSSGKQLISSPKCTKANKLILVSKYTHTTNALEHWVSGRQKALQIANNIQCYAKTKKRLIIKT